MNLRFPGKIYSSIARHTAHHYSHDLRVPLQTAARDRSARFVAEHMTSSIATDDRRSLVEMATRRAKLLNGCFCEFGVYKGESLRWLSKAAPDRLIHGFDSFDGLPTDWRHGFGASTFRTSVPRFAEKNITLHAGLFEDTLPEFVANLKGGIALAHIDCDIYASTRTVLDFIVPKLVPGAILLFDEYFNYPGWEEHEHKALSESVAAGALDVEYAAYNQTGEQVMVIVLPTPGDR